MASVTVSTRVDRPVAEVFAYVADSRNDVHWAPLVDSVEMIEGDAPGPGTVYAIVQRVGPSRRRIEMRTAEFEAPGHLAWTMQTPQFRYRGVVDLVADGEATMFTQTNTLTFPLPGLGLLWKASARRVMRAQCHRLKAAIEAAPEA